MELNETQQSLVDLWFPAKEAEKTRPPLHKIEVHKRDGLDAPRRFTVWYWLPSGLRRVDVVVPPDGDVNYHMALVLEKHLFKLPDADLPF